MTEGTDTITARATPPGEGAIAIIRISGPGTLSLIRKCFKSGDSPLHTFNRLTHGCFIDPIDNSLIDEVLCVLFKKPHSYTGEDAAEIHCHGGPAIIARGLDVLCSKGARMAEPGEFTKRAFLNGKMDLTRAEAVCDLIRSQTSKASKLALRQLQGKLSQKIQAVKQNIITIAAEIEARLDFPDEELGEINEGSLLQNFNLALDEIQNLLEKGLEARIYRQGAKVVLLGKPNTGKSSLFNALLKIERAIVTPHPGTTRDSIESTVDLRGCPVTFVDTAGLRKSESEVELLGIQRTKKEVSEADLTLFLLDASSPLDHEDLIIYEELIVDPFILVINKIDLPKKLSEEKTAPIKEKARKNIELSALTGQGVESLEEAVAEALLSGAITSEDALVTNQRHIGLLRRALESLRSARDGLSKKIYGELLMVDIRDSILALSQITGEEAGDEILDLIFSRFCIGK